MARPSSKGLAQLSGKHVLVDKANTTVIVAAAAAAAIVVFCIFASVALIDKISYQNKVISLRKDANNQLEDNLAAKDQLTASYAAFEDSPESVIGTSDKNSKIVLDALPSKYDFPALATSLDWLIASAGMQVESITGVDEETTATQSSVNPKPVAIPFEIIAKGNYESAQRLITDLQRSIRPFKIIAVSFNVEDEGVIRLSVRGETAYQPAKEIGIIDLKVDKEGEFVTDSQSPQTAEVQEGQN